ncbi:SGNH/GDSL hydrolase family protein [Mucilaginibacter sp.]
MSFTNSRFTFLLFAVLLLSSFKTREITWVAIGDSITYLNDHTNETGNRVSKGYLTRVVEHFNNLHYINKGYNGWTSGNIAQQIDSLGLVKADIYTIFLGTNDWWQGRPLGNLKDYIKNKGNKSVYASFRIIINKIRTLNPQAKIVLITPMQRADFVYINDPKNNSYGSYKAKNGQYLESFANAIDSIDHYEHIPVIDLYHNPALSFNKLVNFKRLKDPATGQYVNYQYPEAAKIPFNPSNDDYPYPKKAIGLTYDGLHPSDKGNSIIAAEVVKTFSQLGLPITYK